MENTTIVKLSNLEESYVEEAAELLVNSFYSMFKGISKNREILCRLFTACMQQELFYVLLQNNKLAGIIAVSDSNQRAIVIHESICISLFGIFKGKILTRQLQRILSVPAVTEKEQGYVDFIATAASYKRCGVATRLLSYMEDEREYRYMYLDVLNSNHSAIRLYEKNGYHVESVKKNLWMFLAGIGAMHIMKKELINTIK